MQPMNTIEQPVLIDLTQEAPAPHISNMSSALINCLPTSSWFSSSKKADTNEEVIEKDTESVTWPPEKFQPGPSQLTNLRTTYDMEFSDPSSPDTVLVIVGKSSDSAMFTLPKAELEASSSFFAKALKAAWTRKTQRAMVLPDVIPAVFDLYARWLCSGAKILSDVEDWKASFTTYLQWRRELAHDAEISEQDPKKFLCPGNIWDFSLTTQAWFLGEFLKAPGFQNHCIGYLYHMNLRFDHVDNEEPHWDPELEHDWQCDTVAYVSLKDVLLTCEQTAGQPSEPPLYNRHPLRRFYAHWLAAYWFAYKRTVYFDNVEACLLELATKFPDFITQKMYRETEVWESEHGYAVGWLEDFYVKETTEDESSEDGDWVNDVWGSDLGEDRGGADASSQVSESKDCGGQGWGGLGAASW